MADECWALVMESTRILRLFKNEDNTRNGHSFPGSTLSCLTGYSRGYILRVFDSLRGREGKTLLADFLKEWRCHNWMMVTLSPSLEDLVVPHDSLPLNQVGNECFSNVVYKQLKVEILDATSSLIDGLRQQNGTSGDHFLMKRLLTSIHEIGVRDDFELELKNVVSCVDLSEK